MKNVLGIEILKDGGLKILDDTKFKHPYEAMSVTASRYAGYIDGFTMVNHY